MKRIIYFFIVMAFILINALSASSQPKLVKITDYSSGWFGNPFIIDAKGNLWFYNKVLSKYDGVEIKLFNEIMSGPIIQIYEDNDMNIWFCSQKNGVYKYDGKKIESIEELKTVIISTIYEDKKGNIWFGSSKNGLFKYDKNKTWTNYSKKEGLDNRVSVIFEDFKENLWLCTGFYGRVIKYDGQIFTHYSKEDGLETNQIMSMFLDKTGNIIVVCRNKGIMSQNPCIMKFIDNKWSKLVDCPYPITVSYVASNNVIWLGGMKQHSFSPGAVGTAVTILSEGLNDWILANYSDGEIKVFNPNNTGILSIPYDISTNIIFEDSKGTIWVALNPGVIKIDGTKWEYIPELENVELKGISSIIEDKNKNVWISFSGSSGSCIAKYNGNTFSVIKDENAGKAYKIVEGIDGKMWVMTTIGIYYIKND